MRNKQICIRINISRRVVSLDIIEWCVQSIQSKLRWKFGVNALITNFQIEISKKRMDLQTCEQLCSMKSSYLCKMCVYFSELVFLNATNGYLHLSWMLIEKNLFFFWRRGGGGQREGGGTQVFGSPYRSGCFKKALALLLIHIRFLLI